MSWTLTAEVLSKYVNPTFVETGTHEGGAIALALEWGFEDIRSIDVERHVYYSAVRRFSGNKKVKLYLGDAGLLIKDMIADVNTKITFWLDAHDGYTSTLWDELEAIRNHPVKGHTILIDDRDWWPTWKLDENRVRETILGIHPDYKFSYEPNRYGLVNIFVATL